MVIKFMDFQLMDFQMFKLKIEHDKPLSSIMRLKGFTVIKTAAEQ